MSGMSGDLLDITLTGEISNVQAVKFENIIASEPTSVRHELDDLSIEFGITGIGDLAVYNEVRIYAENGAIIIESPVSGEAQFVQMNGMTTPIRVEAGRNVYLM